MPRLATAILVSAVIVFGCDQDMNSNQTRAVHPSSLHELLMAHDQEIAEHGKDLKYIDLIGNYGRRGVLSSLDHLVENGTAISSYNGIGLVFGVAESAHVKAGYDICADQVVLARLSQLARTEDVPAYQRSMYLGFLRRYCERTNKGSVARPDGFGNPLLPNLQSERDAI